MTPSSSETRSIWSIPFHGLDARWCENSQYRWRACMTSRSGRRAPNPRSTKYASQPYAALVSRGFNSGRYRAAKPRGGIAGGNKANVTRSIILARPRKPHQLRPRRTSPSSAANDDPLRIELLDDAANHAVHQPPGGWLRISTVRAGARGHFAANLTTQVATVSILGRSQIRGCGAPRVERVGIGIVQAICPVVTLRLAGKSPRPKKLLPDLFGELANAVCLRDTAQS